MTPEAKRRDLVREYFEAKLNQRVDRRDFLRLSSGVVVTTSLTGLLAACAGAATPAPTAVPTAAATAAPPTPKPTVDITGATIDFMGLEGEDGGKSKLAEAWRNERKITLNTIIIDSDEKVFTAIKAGQVFDIVMSFNPYVQRFAVANIITPIDTSRLTNWKDVWPGLVNSTFLNVNGQPYGVPIVWGDGPYFYNPKKVLDADKPKSFLDLLDPKWKKRITMSNDPALAFTTFGLALGFTNSPNLTKDQLAQVVEKSTQLVKEQVVTYAKSYADATDILIRGEADLSLLGWEAMLNFAKDKGAELAYDFFKESAGGWCDSQSIPVTAADVDAAYAYMDACISPEINAEIASSLESGTTNSKAVGLVGGVSKLYNYEIVKDASRINFQEYLPPEQPTDPNVASHQEWLDAWAKLSA